MSPGATVWRTSAQRLSAGSVTPPAKFVRDEEGRCGVAMDSMVSGGCVISGASLHRSLLFTGVRVQSRAELRGAVVLPFASIGRGARLTNVVVDRGVSIPEGLVVGEDERRDAQRFRRSGKGVCLITQPMIDRLTVSAPHPGMLGRDALRWGTDIGS